MVRASRVRRPLPQNEPADEDRRVIQLLPLLLADPENPAGHIACEEMLDWMRRMVRRRWSDPSFCEANLQRGVDEDELVGRCALELVRLICGRGFMEFFLCGEHGTILRLDPTRTDADLQAYLGALVHRVCKASVARPTHADAPGSTR